MSLFQCGVCGCCENTALACQGCDGYPEQFFDWTGFEDRKGKKLCSACAPTKYSNGSPTEFGKWHGAFPRRFLPMGAFRTARNGNLEHIETGNQDISGYVIPAPEWTPAMLAELDALVDEIGLPSAFPIRAKDTPT